MELKPEYLTVKELAVYLGMDEKWIYERTSPKARKKAEKEGKPTLPIYRLGKYVKVKVAEVDEWCMQFKE